MSLRTQIIGCTFSVTSNSESDNTTKSSPLKRESSETNMKNKRRDGLTVFAKN